MRFKAELSEDDLPEGKDFDSVEDVEVFMQMMEASIKDFVEEIDYVSSAGDVAISLEADIGEGSQNFSWNVAEWCVLCHNCGEVVARGEEAQHARKKFDEHIDSERNPCVDRHNRTLMNDFKSIQKIQEAISE